MKLYNTLTRKIEEFAPIDPPNVGMYTCGPTVYGPGHLGHARSYTTFDLLKRAMIYNGYKVKHVLNITDVHDDMIKKASEEGITIFELADRYLPMFKQDMVDLNVLPADFYPRVTEHIEEIIEMIKTLIDKGYAYVEQDGSVYSEGKTAKSVYYDVSKFKDYGKLSGRKPEEAKTGTRVDTDKYEKNEASDFALWKSASQGVTLRSYNFSDSLWDSPWGMGRPGWHIECSAMAKKYLADGERSQTLDLHAGAMDLKFPHHENEIAQSEAANGVKFVNFWFHAGLLEIEGKKMSKSLGNYLEIHEVKEKGIDPLALRYLFLTVSYRDKLNFTWESLEAAKKAFSNLQSAVGNLRQMAGSVSSLSEMKLEKLDLYRQRFLEAINNDLAIPQALVIVWELLKSEVPAPDKLDLLLNFDAVLGLNLSNVPNLPNLEIPEEIKKLAEQREKLRKDGKWSEADELRKEIEKAGFKIKDTGLASHLLE